MLQNTIHMKSGLSWDLDQLTRIIKAYDLSDFFLFSQQIIHVVLQCLNYDVQFLILFGVYYDCTNKSFKFYVIQLLHCIKGSPIMYHATFSLISNEIASFIRLILMHYNSFMSKLQLLGFQLQ
jgi:hypothetical protein